MPRIIRSIAILIPVLLSVEGFRLTAKGQTPNIPELPPALQKPVCENDWNTSLSLLGPLIADPAITPAYRAQLVDFHHVLQNWQGSRSTISNIPGCDSVSLLVESPPLDNSASTPLDLTTGFQSVLEMHTSPSGYIEYEGLQSSNSANRDCWAIDETGQWIDLNLLCED